MIQKKGQVKISTFIVGMIFLSLVLTFIMVFMSNLSSSYSVSFDNSTLLEFDKMNNLTAQTAQIKNATDIKSDSNLFDVLGKLTSDGVQAVKVSIQSLDIFTSLTESAAEAANFGPVTPILKTAIITSVIIILFIGVLLSAIVKRDL